MVGGNDWLRAEDKVPEEAPSMAGARALNVPPFSVVQSAVHAHEVRARLSRRHLHVLIPYINVHP